MNVEKGNKELEKRENKDLEKEYGNEIIQAIKNIFG